MRRFGLGLAALILLASGWTWATTNTASQFDSKEDVALPLSTDYAVQVFLAGQRACSIVIGDGKTYLGLYVFDRFGNCVAKDDQNLPGACDDLAVEWLPLKTDRYFVDIVNLGRSRNKYELVVK